MASVQNYQCPSCGGPLSFDAKTAKLTCAYCDSSFDPDYVASLHSQQEGDGGIAGAQTVGAGSFDSGGENWDTGALSDDWGADADGMREFSCPSCGAAIVCDSTTAATSCPYCGNPAIVETQFQGSMHPDYIIPFRLKKQDAVDALRQFYAGKPLLPKKFAEQNHLEEARGIYVPFWFFDGTAHGSATFHATTSTTQQRGQSTVRITRNFQCIREGDISFKLVPVDASKRMDDSLMDSIEPYDYSELKPFSTGFLPGYYADVHDVSAEECFSRADARCAATCITALSRTVKGYETCRLTERSISLSKGTVHYGLLPVYILNTRFADQTHTFAVNGQSGKVVGNLPSTSGRTAGFFLRKFLVALLIALAVSAGLVLLLGSAELLAPLAFMSAFIALVAAGVSLSRAKGKMRSVAQAAEASGYEDGTVRLRRQEDVFKNETATVISQNPQQGSPAYRPGQAPMGGPYRPGQTGASGIQGSSFRPGQGMNHGGHNAGARPTGGSFPNRPPTGPRRR